MTLHIGGIYQHPEEGPILILDGAYERNGRVSNHWNWVRVNPDGTEGKKGNGYGGPWPQIEGATVEVTRKITLPPPGPVTKNMVRLAIHSVPDNLPALKKHEWIANFINTLIIESQAEAVAPIAIPRRTRKKVSK